MRLRRARNSRLFSEKPALPDELAILKVLMDAEKVVLRVPFIMPPSARVLRLNPD